MLLKEFLLGVQIGFIVSIPLGPMGLLCVQRTLSRGRRYGFATGVGAALSDAVYATIAAFSMSLVVDFVTKFQFAMLILVVLLLFGFGWHTFRHNPVKELRKKDKSGKLWTDFASTFMLTFSNPLTFLILLTVFTQINIMNVERGAFSTALLIIGIFLGACLWWFILTFIVGTFKRYVNLRNLWWVNKIAGAFIMIIAVLLLVDALFPSLFEAFKFTPTLLWS